MSSVISSKKYKIILFQRGLSDLVGLKYTINSLASECTKYIKYPKIIDMQHYNADESAFYRAANGYYNMSTVAEEDFQTLIYDIVEYAKNNLGNNILVETELTKGFNADHYVEPIVNQAARLVKIINSLKQYDNVDVMLVGHSQGGLVNLEAATIVPTKISKMVSISTPYAPVYLADKAMILEWVFNMFGESVYEMLFEVKDTDAYNNAVKILNSSSYFSDLKKRWDNLLERPKLYVITGTAGHMHKIIPGISTIDSYNPDLIQKESFDGLVKISEQKAIDHATFIDLVDENVPCYNSGQYASSICYSQCGLSFSCKHSCTLSSISFSGTILDAVISGAKCLLNGEKIDEDHIPVIKAIFAGLDRSPENMPVGDYQSYYNIYANDYSHLHIKTASKTIATLASLLL